MKTFGLLLSVLLLFSGAAFAEKDGYELVQTTYRENQILVSYPQLISWSNVRRQTAVNALLKEEALKGMAYFRDRKNLSLFVSHQVLWKTPDLLSVAFVGTGRAEGTSLPKRLYYTTTIDLKLGRRLRLPDICLIDRRFAEKLKTAEMGPLLEETAAGKIPAIRTDLNNREAEDLISELYTADQVSLIGTEKQSTVYSGMTKEAVVISVEVSPELGDHAEFVLPFKVIADFILPDYRHVLRN